MLLLRRATARAVLLAAAMLLTGCTIIAFTQGYRREHSLTDDDVKRMRFRTSDELVLQRSTALREPDSAEGVFRASPSAMVQEIVIPKDTPLVVMKVVRASAADGADPEAAVEYLQVALSVDAPGKSLWFSTLRPKHAGRYELTPVAQLDEDAKPVLASAPVIRYDGLDYRLRDDGMWQVFLCVGQVLQAHARLSAETPRK